MKDDWNDLEEQIEKGPKSAFNLAIKVILLVMLLVAVLGGISYIGGFFTETGQVIKEEFGPRAMLEKYEWFKDAAAELDKKNADIQVYQSRLNSMKESYEGLKRWEWGRTDKEQFNLWNQEVAGVVASFNGLAAEYNSQMAKFNWKFANKGMLPQGANEPLPREFKTYQIN